MHKKRKEYKKYEAKYRSTSTEEQLQKYKYRSTSTEVHVLLAVYKI